MKRKMLAVFAAITLVGALCLTWAQVIQPLITPVTWVDSTGTNAVQLTSSGAIGPTFSMINGTNVYTAITTNKNVLTGTGVTNIFVFKNGILTAIQ